MRRVLQMSEQKTFDIDLTGVDYDNSWTIGTNVLSLFSGILKGSGQNQREGNRIFVTGFKVVQHITSNTSAEWNVCRNMILAPKGSKTLSTGMLPANAQAMLTDTASKDLHIYKDDQFVTRPYDASGTAIDNLYIREHWQKVGRMVNWDTTSTGVDPITNNIHIAFRSTNSVGTDPSIHYGRIRVYFRDL